MCCIVTRPALLGVSLKKGPRPTVRDGPAARRPAAYDGSAARSRFSTVFCPGFPKSRTAARHGPAARRPGSRPTMARQPGGPVLIFQSFLSSGKSTLMYRSASSLGVQNAGQKTMYDPMKCPERWAFIPSTVRPSHQSPIPGTDLPSQALIFCPLHWSSVPCTDLLSLVLMNS